LGKDITNKALKGLPGIQKEGTDGIITSAEFILYPEYEHKATFCLEFFGEDMDEASRVIVRIAEEFPNQGEEALMALEHFDDEYCRAIHYKVKAARSESPKAVLLIDMVGHTQSQLDRGIQRLMQLMTAYENTEIFIARDPAEAARYWLDRKRLGAIAARTNAFKLNEDIVLPLTKLADFARFVEHYNIEENRFNQQECIQHTRHYLEHAVPLEDPEWMATKIPTARQLCDHALQVTAEAPPPEIDAETPLLKLREDLLELFQGYEKIRSEIRRIFEETRTRLIIIATHMHAGDGNVHVNIPVFSNDREMMLRAAKTADDVMTEAVRLEGVVSGEHGIGITKMHYLDRERIEALSAYRQTVDPHGLMNPGKLADSKVPDQVFTPSFNLLGLEARILRHGSLEALANKIANCVRCGKCKADCCVFYPDQNLFYHPRNKNLAIAALIEALLYDAQRLHAPRFKILKQLEDIADHCTLCHKCLSPCPVKIDTAEVSVLERNILHEQNFKHKPLATRLSLYYLNSQSRVLNAVFRKTVLQWGSAAQRYGVRLMKAMPEFLKLKERRSLQLLSSPLPSAGNTPLHGKLPKCNPDQALVIHPPEAVSHTVFYFPGCGSERLYPEIAKAAIYILLKSGTRVVLPPPFLCCGFPARANAETEQHGGLTLKDSIIFSQIREMLGYLSFDACVVSCGTCREALLEMESGNIFDCEVVDVNRFALEHGLQVSAWNSPVIGARATLYHAPCHDSLQGEALSLLKQHAGYDLDDVPHCCSEAGTLSLSRPDITNAMRLRKADALQDAVRGRQKETILLTNCPACLQGLGRNAEVGMTPRHIAVELAIKAGGEKWEEELEKMLGESETVTF
jgi:FAD/FMN-containing dehydrogenase/Fe-S oxidoreductase